MRRVQFPSRILQKISCFPKIFGIQILTPKRSSKTLSVQWYCVDYLSENNGCEIVSETFKQLRAKTFLLKKAVFRFEIFSRFTAQKFVTQVLPGSEVSRGFRAL